MADGADHGGEVPGFSVPVHRALTEHILLGGAPRSLAILNGLAQRFGLIRRHDSGRHIVAEREHSDGGLADRESRRGHHGRQQPLEPLPRLGQFGRDPRGAWMNFGADVMGDKANDPLAIGGRQSFTGVGKTL